MCPTRRREKGSKTLLEEIIAINFTNLGKETDFVQEAQGLPKKMNPKRTIPRYIIIKMAKLNIKNLKRSKGKATNHMKRNSHKTITWLGSKHCVREQWHNTFKVIKGKHVLPRMLYPTKLSLRFERGI